MTAQHTVNGNVFLSPVFLCSVLLGMVAVVANKRENTGFYVDCALKCNGRSTMRFIRRSSRSQ